MHTFAERVVGAARLKPNIYEEVEADPRATAQAMGVVVLSSVAGGYRPGGGPGRGPHRQHPGGAARLAHLGRPDLRPRHQGLRAAPDARRCGGVAPENPERFTHEWSQMPTCIYCPNEANSREHWIPRGLGAFRGYTPLLNQVCGDCNRRLGQLDQELIRTGPTGFQRALHGVQGSHGPSKVSPFHCLGAQLR